MWKKVFPGRRKKSKNYPIDDFDELLGYVNDLASHKLGYPVSLLTYIGIINNQILGISPGTLANVLLNNVGDPFKDSETSLLEVKKHERAIISILAKYYGLPKDEARGYVTTGGTEGNFASLWWSRRYLINNYLNKLIEIDDLVKSKSREDRQLQIALTKVPTNQYQQRSEILSKLLAVKTEIDNNKNIKQEILTPTIFFSKGPTHYSIPKIAEILHYQLRPVAPNSDGSLDLQALKKELILNREAHRYSAVVVIANIGTTVTGAIDDVPRIRQILQEIYPTGNFTIHMDGALTGFVLPILKPFGDIHNYFDDLGAHTLAVSAHKYPGLSQPCGIVLATKAFYEQAFAKSERGIEYVGNILDMTISGSRSGLNVLMFYHALITLGLDQGNEKISRMVTENIENAKYLYQQLVLLYGDSNIYYPFHFNVMFPRPSKELAQKYQLMLTGDRATICVLTNVTKKLIDRFIMDLKIDINKEKVMSNVEAKVDHTLHTLDQSYAQKALDLFIKSFCENEPITKHLGIHYKDYEPFAKDIIQKAIKDGLSKIAVDQQGRVVACTIAEDIADPFIPHLAHYPKLKPILNMLDKLSASFLKGKKFTKGKIVHVWIAAVDTRFRGQGLSTETDMASVEAAARKGFDYAYAEFTNKISENVTHQFKILKQCNKIVYSEFTDETGQKPFAGLPGEATSYLATIRPGVKLDAIDHCYDSKEDVNAKT